MSPTVFRDGSSRFFFFSREEERLHVHVTTPQGEAKFWIDPVIALATYTGLNAKTLKYLQGKVEEHEQEIRDAWQRHFG